MRFGAICPNWQTSSEIGTKSFRLYYGHPWLAGKRLMRAMQCMQFRAKSAKNDLKPTDFLKRNFYFETEGVFIREKAKQASFQTTPQTKVLKRSDESIKTLIRNDDATSL